MDQLLQQLQSDMLEAKKSKDNAKSEVLQLIISDIKTEQINTGKDVSQDKIFKLMQSSIKAMKEAAHQYAQAGNKEAEAKEQTQIKILEAYMPAMMSESEISEVVEQTIKETGASGMQDMGRVMAAVMAKLTGKADGGEVQKVVQTKLKG